MMPSYGFKYAFFCLFTVSQGSFQLWFLINREVMPKKEFYKMLEIISHPKHVRFFLWVNFVFSLRDYGISVTLVRLVSTIKRSNVICF